MRLKTAAATAPALQHQTRPVQTRLRAIPAKGAESNSASPKPMATSASLRGRAVSKAGVSVSSLSAVPRKTVQPSSYQRGSAQPKIARQNTAKTNVSRLTTAQQNAKLARRDRVVLEHLPLVKAIAIRVHENLPVHVDVDDLVHSGVLGLFDAASKYNPDKQVAFSSYAKHRIKGAILDSLRQLDWASRDMRRRHKQVEAATRELAATLQRNPTEAEVAQKLGIDQERWRSMMLDLRNVGLVSASTRTNESDDLPAPDFPCKPESHPDSICAREQLRGVLGVAMKTLPERYQKVVSLYYSAEMTMKEIGGILGINESRVSQIHKAALEKMQVVLQTNGITSPQAF
jgi:RNA polymerase sigma factor for flagellar operon FliA